MRGGDLNPAVFLEQGGVSRRLTSEDFPLRLGPESEAPRAYLGLSGSELFLQPEGNGRPVVCNGSLLESSQWLRDGDVVDLGGVELRVSIDGDSIVLRLGGAVVAAGAQPSEPTPPEIQIRPIRFEPSRLAARGRRRGLPRLATVGLWLLIAGVAIGGAYLFTAKPGEIDVAATEPADVPEPEEIPVEPPPTPAEPAVQEAPVLEPPVAPDPEPQPAPVQPAAPQIAELALTSVPDGAAVTVDGVFEGRTPIEIELTPGEVHQVVLSKAGFESANREVKLAPGASESMAIELVGESSEILVVTRPPGADVRVDGELRGTTDPAGLRVALLGAGPFELEVSKEGYASITSEVVAQTGLEQSLELDLKTLEEERAERTPPVLHTGAGQEMRLIPGGRFQMGAPRREPGRRPNETERQVELTRPFYIATREVSNAEFREFDLSHLSGTVGSATLELDDHPAVQVSWAAAARYCNWLSERDSLPLAYLQRDGRMVPVEPMNTGYRLPTEAEWAWVARYPEPPAARKYPWGTALPIPPLAGNFGDRSAAALLNRTLPGYDDGYPATAPVGSFEPNPLGLFHLGGNVAEWVNDRYAVDPRTGDGPEQDPFGPPVGESYVIRGASWTTSTVTELRLSYRDSGSGGRHDVGFRIVRYAE